MTQKERDDWYQQFSRHCGAELNRHRSGVQMAIKQEMQTICKAAAPHAVVLVANCEKCLKRDLDIDDDDNVKLFEAHHNQIVPRATGTTERWNTSHRGHFCLHNGHPPNKKQEIDHCVAPKTEAHGLLAINGN